LTRARGFTQDDAHIFCTTDQVKQEVSNVIDLVLYIFKTLQFDDFIAQISLRDPENPDKYIGSDENWDKAEKAIAEVAVEKGLETITELGEAAFYGPKLDFMVRDAIGRKWQLGTVQIDYSLPERFELEYVGADNQKHRPVMIHRAPFGSMERFVAILIEHCAGKFPLWLTPEQARILPVSDKFNDYAKEVSKSLEKRDIRALVDDRSEKVGKKIREAELAKVPYMLIVGGDEADNGTVAVRKQGEGDVGGMTTAAFADRIDSEVREMLGGDEMIEQPN
jgi:threonyl-tRNA synthetase